MGRRRFETARGRSRGGGPASRGAALKGGRGQDRGRNGRHIHPGLRPVTEDMRMNIQQQLDDFRASDENGARVNFAAGACLPIFRTGALLQGKHFWDAGGRDSCRMTLKARVRWRVGKLSADCRASTFLVAP